MVENMVNGNIHEGNKLSEIAETIRAGLKGAYEQDHKAFSDKSDHYADVRSQLGLSNSIWSIYEVDNLSDRHPFEGVDRVVYKDHWGDKPPTGLVSVGFNTIFVTGNPRCRIFYSDHFGTEANDLTGNQSFIAGWIENNNVANR